MAQARRVKAGIIGCGDVSLHSYFPYVSRVFDLVATCDLIEDRAKEMARIWGAKEYYTDVDKMLTKANIEAVFVLASMSDHAVLSLKAAQAGKHFLVQKPFATSLGEGLKVVKAAREAKVKGLAEPNYWLDPVYMKAKEIIRQGHIGTVHYILGRSERNFVPLWGGRTFYEAKGGGMLFDMGVYIISALAYLMGPAQKVTGVATLSVPNRPAKWTDDVFTGFLKTYKPGDSPFSYRSAPGTVPAVVEGYDNTFTLIKWPNDCLGCVVANSDSFVLPPSGASLVLCGEKGTIAFDMQGSGSPLSVGTLDKNSEYYVSGPQPSPDEPEEVGWYHFPDDVFPRWNYTAGSVQHLHDCIVNDTEPLASIEWGCHVAEIMIKSLESAAKGQTLDLITTF